MLSLLPNLASAADSTIVIRDAWIREAPPNSAVLAGYMILENQTDKSQSLTSASSTAFGRAMIHRTEQKDGMAHMMHQKQVTIPAKGKVVFAPGGYHLMLMEPKRSLRAGDQADVDLFFEDESKISVIFEVRKDMPMKDGEDMKHHHGMKCGGM
jgi:copper(I)-binding protein